MTGLKIKRLAIPVEIVRAFLDYDPESGVLTHKIAPGTGRGINSRNRQWPGLTFGTKKRSGYIIGSINCVRIAAHRAAWAIMTGEWPPYDIDHVDMDKSNNRWSNLRLADRSQNRRNSRVDPRSKSGLKGVSRRGRMRRWMARIKVDGKMKYLGLYDTPEEASAAYMEAAKAVAGEFARSS